MQGCAGRIHPAPPNSSADARPIAFIATAYCAGTVTATGAAAIEGIVAADPAVLPLGTAVRVAGAPKPYDRIYTVMDTGPHIQGRRLDVYIADCAAARRFGRRSVRVSVVRRTARP